MNRHFVHRAVQALFATIVLALAPTAFAEPKVDKNGNYEAEAHNFDQHQVLYGTVVNHGRSFVFTISNGQPFRDVDLDGHFQFLDEKGQLLGDIHHLAFCGASNGGSANRCDCHFTDPAGRELFAKAYRVKMYGERPGNIDRNKERQCH